MFQYYAVKEDGQVVETRPSFSDAMPVAKRRFKTSNGMLQVVRMEPQADGTTKETVVALL